MNYKNDTLAAEDLKQRSCTVGFYVVWEPGRTKEL